ncbi:MAG: hypothetical protein KFF68_02665 [Desulfosarcina sp.]|nr:hypothetical protein [Desulfosarcina sp.]
MFRRSNRVGKLRWRSGRVVMAIIVLAVAAACAPHIQKKPFDPRRCMAHVPQHVKGLTILEGPRSKASIIRDMVPAICNGQVLFYRMQSTDPQLQAGSVVFRVAVEYTGEVIAVDVKETTLQSDVFLKKVSDFIMNMDFIGWARNEIDTVFVYPVQFGG